MLDSGIAVVTGAGTGIGAATAGRLARRGLHVCCVGRRAAPLDEVVGAVRQAGGSAEAISADCGTPDGIASVVAAVAERPVAALVHAAGGGLPAPFPTTSWDDLSTALATNLYGPFFLTQGLLDRLVPGGGIVFVGSVSAVRGRSRSVAYGASKAALIGLTRNLAVELGPRARVNCVSPGPVDTDMLERFNEASTAGMSERRLDVLAAHDRTRIVLGRIATPDEVAATIEHLALDATAMTGVDVPIDVGYTGS